MRAFTVIKREGQDVDELEEKLVQCNTIPEDDGRWRKGSITQVRAGDRHRDY